jgi:hypothetical protein
VQSIKYYNQKSKVKSLRNPKKSLIESFSDKEDVN